MAVYSAPFSAIAVTTATDIFHLTVTADAAVQILQVNLGQTTDLGDAAEEVICIGLYRGVTGGTGGTAATEVSYDRADNPAVATAVLNHNSSISTGGTLIDIIPWNIRMPLQYVWTPETAPRFDSSEDPVAFRFMAAPTDSITVSGCIIFKEL